MLPALFPRSSKLPNSVKLGFWDSQSHSQHGLVEIGCSGRCHTANYGFEARPQTPRMGRCFLIQRVLPGASPCPPPRHQPETQQLGLGMKGVGLRGLQCAPWVVPPVAQLGGPLMCPLLPCIFILFYLRDFCILSASGSTGDIRNPFFLPTQMAT